MKQSRANQQRHDDYDGERVDDLNPTASTAGAIAAPARDPAAARFGDDDALGRPHRERGIEHNLAQENGRLPARLADDPLTRGTILWLRYAVLLAITLVVLVVVATFI